MVFLKKVHFTLCEVRTESLYIYIYIMLLNVSLQKANIISEGHTFFSRMTRLINKKHSLEHKPCLSE